MSQIYIINQGTLNSFEKLSANIDADKVLIAIQEAQDLDLRPFLGKAFYDDLIQYFSNASGIASLLFTVNTTTAANGNYANQVLVTGTGTGTGAKATIQVFGGRVSKVTITSHGINYISGDILTCAAIPNAVFTVDAISTEVVVSGTITPAYSDLFNGKAYLDKAGHELVYKGIQPALAYWTLARFIENASFQYTATGGVIKNHDDAQAISQKDVVTIAGRKRSMANAKANDIEQFLWNNKDVYPLWRYNERNKNSRQPGARIRSVDRTAYNTVGYGNGQGLNGFLGGNE